MEWLTLPHTPEFVWYLLLGNVVLVALVDLYIDWRQHRAVSRPARPKELEDLCTEEDYLKSRAYRVDLSLFDFCAKIIGLVPGLLIPFAGIWPIVWKRTGQFMESRLGLSAESEILHSLLFQGFFLVVGTLQSLPFSVYRTFVLEKKHGFNKTTVKTFVLDVIKTLCISAVLGGILMAAILWVILRTGKSFVLWTCLLVLGFQLLMVVLYPTVIQPLFNKFTPLEKGPLREKIEALAQRVSFPLAKIFVIDGSKRSSHSNAYFFGLFKNKRIVLFDTLLEKMEDDEILAVVGHELGHWAHHHVWIGLAMSELYMICIFYLFSLAMGHGPLYQAFGFAKERPVVIGLSIFSELIAPMGFVLSLVSSWVSRRNEFQADRYAINLGYGEKLPVALVKLGMENKGMVHPDPVYSTLHFSHPPLSERIPAIHKYSAQLKKQE